MKPRHFIMALFGLLLAFSLTPVRVTAQSLTSGGVTGVVTDPSNAVVPGAQVTLKSSTKGTTQTTTTSGTGVYQFSLLDPGPYSITVGAKGFQSSTRPVDVTLGQPTTLNIQLSLGSTGTTVTVTEAAPLVQTDNGNTATTIGTLQVSQIPNPGNDITAPAQLAPGSTMNTLGGYGNFSSYGLPATSNLFTLDGMDDNDPFLNLNNSGATNLLLGQNEVQQVTVVSNGYTGEYGGLAGANVNYITKSGSNGFHGDANYYYNGRALNANDFFNNATGTPRPFDVANQWGADLGGPIVKNKLFFYVDQEGLRVTLPTSVSANIPTTAFENAVMANLAGNANTNNPQTLNFYSNIFKLYNGAPGASIAKNDLPPGTAGGMGNGCSNFGGLGPGVPCALSFNSTASSQTHEWLLATRADYNIGTNDRMFVRYQMDRGVQATFTDSINPIFNATSVQPEYQGQLEETHTFNGTMVNQFVMSSAWYSAIFAPLDLNKSLAAFPTTLSFSDGSLQTLGGLDFIWPQGRNVTQYGFSDDLSKSTGNHSLKFGVKFRRNDVSDHDNGILSSGLLTAFTLNDFANGGITGDSYTQTFTSSFDLPVAIYSLGAYAQDDWRMMSNFTLTLALRAEHFSNPVCQTNCFGRLTGPFNQISHSPSQPYNQALLLNQNQALSGLTSIVWEPRVGFAWQPFGIGRNTVIRGGIGIFADEFPATVADSFSGNPPLLNSFTVGNDYGVPCASGSSCTPTNIFADAANSNAAFLAGFKAGQTLAQIQASDPAFVPPGISVSDKNSRVPQYQKWSLGIQQGVGSKTVFGISYEGNHGVYELVPVNAVNAFATGFTGLPAAAPDPRFGTVTVFTNAGVSNYNGVTVSATHHYSSGLIQANYTFSHAFDDVSNAGLLPFSSAGFGATNTSLLNPQNPNNIQGGYGPADYDVRHYLSLNYVWMLPLKRLTFGRGPSMLLDGWQVAGSMFARSGLPFSVTDLGSSAALAGNNYGATLYANFAGGKSPSCGLRAASLNGTPCLVAAPGGPFSPSPTAFGNSSRNAFRGPGYTDMDFSLMKYTTFPHLENVKFGIGAQAYNVFNHPNFDNPVANVSNPSFGQILRALGPPTTILGSVLGGDASPRLLQITGRLSF